MSLQTDRSTGPDEVLLDEALQDLQLGEVTYKKTRLGVMNRMLYNGYELEAYGSSPESKDYEMYFVHRTVLDGWEDGLEDDSQGLIAKRLVIRF